MHHLQAWNEAVCGGAWGDRARGLGEAIRRSQDLDQWASFHESFAALTALIVRIAGGKNGDPPSSVTILSGDVHHGYLAEASFGDGNASSKVHQAVCSPLRNALPNEKSRLQLVSWTGPATLAGRLLSRLAGVEAPDMTWHLTHDRPWFENQVATMELDGRGASITFEEAVTDGSGDPGLRKIFARRLA
jgi:hypothetical protein